MIILKKIKNHFLYLFFLFPLCFIAQEKENKFWKSSVYNNKILNYLLVPDSNTRASLIQFNYQYLYIPKSTSFKSGGGYANVSLNLARFFTKKIIFGISLDVKTFKGFLKQRFSSDFINDFNSNFISEYSNERDSVRAYSLKDAMNGSAGSGITGNNISGYGIVISPFPDRYGGILVQLKRNIFTFPFFGTNTKKIHSNDEGYFLNLDFQDSYSMELSINPYKFAKHERIKLKELKSSIYKFFVITFYYQHISFNTAKFDGVSFSSFVKPEFISKYNNINNFGIKIGLAIY